MAYKINDSNRFVLDLTDEEIARCKAHSEDRRLHPEKYPEITAAEGRRRHLINLKEKGFYSGPIPDPEPQYADKSKAA